jgi:hypothetical protein
VQRLVRQAAGRLAGWAVVLGACGLAGLGIYIGRFLRWNSWDLVLAPHTVLGDVAVRLSDPLGNLQTYGVWLMFSALLFVCYLTFASLQQPASADAAPPASSSEPDGPSGAPRGSAARGGHASGAAALEHERVRQRMVSHPGVA